MLGWLHRERGVALDQLSLTALLPSSGREGVSLVFDYLLWLSTERDVSVRTEGLVVGGWGGWEWNVGWDEPVGPVGPVGTQVERG